MELEIRRESGLSLDWPEIAVCAGPTFLGLLSVFLYKKSSVQKHSKDEVGLSKFC